MLALWKGFVEQFSFKSDVRGDRMVEVYSWYEKLKTEKWHVCSCRQTGRRAFPVTGAWNNLPSGITCSPPLLTLKRERLKCTYSALLPRSLAF